MVEKIAYGLLVLFGFPKEFDVFLPNGHLEVKQKGNAREWLAKWDGDGDDEWWTVFTENSHPQISVVNR